MALHKVRHANAHWEGTLKDGGGSLKMESGAYEGPYTWADRFADGKGTNPEELLGAAHAGCYTMFLSAILTNNDFYPTRLDTEAAVHLEDGPTITRIELAVEAVVDGLDDERFQQFAQEAKEKCPVSKALAAVPEIVLKARLVG
jgi:osmotically inducible protein OsmC